MASLLRSLVELSEKAANLARIIRSERALFELLVEEKTGEQKNKRFVRDFKTLGDVLIQEMIHHEIAKKFPNLGDYVFGEETNKFTNTLGESITVAVQSTEDQTCQLLTKVLDGNGDAATLLAKAVHCDDVALPTDPGLDSLNAEVDVDSLGIWIDPIDGTAQYIKGLSDELPTDGIHEEGLQCAIILIGAFDRQSGEPVIGVINQPFCRINGDNQWQGRYVWGISHGNLQANSLTPVFNDLPSTRGLSVITSCSENEDIRAALHRLTCGKIRYASGAGYKILCAVERRVDAYILTAGSTFKWDTCGPHAILRSLGGGVVDLQAALRVYRGGQHGGEPGSGADPAGLDLGPAELHYHERDASSSNDPGQMWANAGGLVAYRSKEVLLQFLEALSTHPSL
ncbi:inositol polyphosphate 1-phosphatase-like [Acanthaster planci]|uniref:inositol-1,4-bisphosphate 1-phosphatase n=1 Tax=Acanthaster planci TaxID=133434 RepID=A0A8B7XH94_ACAPL|nr:inositol polyphosphate 1-phosphatase-like [Acanthaster planci]XP_022080168.1 inositol polyphosphate 1-phosphatase-like [Acanthaster planci]